MSLTKIRIDRLIGRLTNVDLEDLLIRLDRHVKAKEYVEKIKKAAVYIMLYIWHPYFLTGV